MSQWQSESASAGLFGTNDNEAGNEFQLPNCSQAHSVQEFIRSWQVNQVGGHCRIASKNLKPCVPGTDQRICQTLFRYTYSPLRNCFRVVDPTPFYAMCVTDMCESTDIKPACSVAAAFVHLCNRDFVPLEIPSQCPCLKNVLSFTACFRTLPNSAAHDKCVYHLGLSHLNTACSVLEAFDKRAITERRNTREPSRKGGTQESHHRKEEHKRAITKRRNTR
ncbi:IgGFc-binding protein-like [Protopterus annectens]|uniref:IgGFc-binding protein-like n=1 Tax=Protopterus annectens TaxID=7888 RepID=UPI001CF99F2E|nr:IgGFc-binding protein-like [Protopterus annectens]